MVNFLATNTFLHMIHYTHSNKCTFCTNEPETLQHLFYENYGKVLKIYFKKTKQKKPRSYHHTKKIYKIMFAILEGEHKKKKGSEIFNINYYIYNMKIL